MVIIDGKRRERDFYPTPPEFCAAALAHCQPWIAREPDKALRVLDAGAGAGAWGLALKAVRPAAHMVGVDLPGVFPVDAYDEWHEDYFEVWIAQYIGQPFDLVIGNPPYANDTPEKWLRLIWRHLTPSGRVFWLLRLNWYSSQGRHKRLFMAGYHPAHIWQSASRISFTGDGKTDDTDYAMYLWTKDHDRDYGMISQFDYRIEQGAQVKMF